MSSRYSRSDSRSRGTIIDGMMATIEGIIPRRIVFVYLLFISMAIDRGFAEGIVGQHASINNESRRSRSNDNEADLSSTSVSERTTNANMYPNRISIPVVVGNRTHSVSLTKHLDLLSPNYKEIHFENGKRIVSKPSLDAKTFCYYEGTMEGDEKSHAAINLCDQKISGTIYFHGLRYEIAENSTSSRLYSIPSHELDSKKPLEKEFKCGHHHNQDDSKSAEINDRLRMKRAAGAEFPDYYKKYLNWKDLYVEMAVVFDNSEYRTVAGNKKRLYNRAKEYVSFVNSYYQPVNIKVALVGVEIWSESDRIMVSENGDTTLDNFLRYRRVQLLPDMPNDHAQLITMNPFTGGVVGKAMKGTICSMDLSGAVVMDHSVYASTVAATMAHEMGHNFGMEHDTDACECPQPKCIMAASSSSGANMYWSSCSMEYLALTLAHGGDFCLHNKPTRLFEPKSPICGNGFVEDGEECDCGLTGICDNPCCNATTCQLADGAICANGDCCDLKKCQYKAIASPCRESRGECDLIEYCSGKSEHCPNDTYKQNGIACDGGQAYCYDGACNSQNSQCQLVWGPTGSIGAPECYGLNTRGDIQGNCGYAKLDGTYTPCTEQDRMCGSLQCSQKAERTAYGDRSLVRMAYTSIRYRDRITTCHVAYIDLGSEENDPGLVPNGAKCGENKMCDGRKCIDVSKAIAVKPCDTNCYGNGVCNNYGHCHCNIGFGGSDCGSIGLGGSIDSGPASIGGGTGFNIGLGVLVFLVVVLPLISAVLTYLYKKGKIRSPKVVKVFDKPHAKRTPTNKPRPPPAGSKAKPAAISTISSTTMPSRTQPTTLPVWPVTTTPAPTCSVTVTSRSFPKPTLTVNLQDGLLPVIVAMVASTTTLGSTSTTTTPRTIVSNGPHRPRRPTEDVLAKVHEIDETTGGAKLDDVNLHEDDPDDVILPRRPAPPPPPGQQQQEDSYVPEEPVPSLVNAKKMFDVPRRDNPKPIVTPPSKQPSKRPPHQPPPAPVVKKQSSEKPPTTNGDSSHVQSTKAQSTMPTKPLLPPVLPSAKPKLTPSTDQQQQADANLAQYSLPDKKPKPPPVLPKKLEPSESPVIAKKPDPSGDQQSSTYYDVMNPKSDRAKPTGPILPQKPSKPVGQTQNDEKPTVSPKPPKPTATKAAFVADLEKKLTSTSTPNLMPNSTVTNKKALVPNNKKPAEVAKKNDGGKDDGLVSALAARFEKSNS